MGREGEDLMIFELGAKYIISMHNSLQFSIKELGILKNSLKSQMMSKNNLCDRTSEDF